ncbi:MAG: hypothetical protein KA010_03315 [Saprospiraceae bacterium]|nr:hypothetical protein [Saprospiraceae bacterium]
MKKIQYSLILIFLVICAQITEAHLPENWKGRRPTSQQSVSFRDGDCSVGNTQTDMEINNVRARLLSRGDFWWDYEDAVYVVPKPVNPQDKSVSSIYAGAVWLGGKDPAGNLKMACQDYGTGNSTDFYPGPLDPGAGTTTADRCKNWDKHFRVLGKSIREHKARVAAAGGEVDPSVIPLDIKGWPAKGNEFFYDIHGFSLPDNPQGLAPFFEDPNGEHYNNIYEPQFGEFPIIQIRNCEPATADEAQFGDEMFFLIYNDAGGAHTQTGTSEPIRMEIQVEAFAYASNNQLNNMTFMRYKLINRAIEEIDSCYFAMWVDPDLGCPYDDYIGCDTTVIGGKPRNLMYIYNQDELDGSSGCSCASPGGGQVTTYCSDVPMLGVDYFRGPLDEDGNELGMSSFTYYFGTGAPNPNMSDPSSGQPQQWYNYLTGKWRDGSPYTTGGYGYGGSGVVTRYAFPSPPDELGGWSLCQEGLAPGDVRSIQASGPFRLLPGAINELIIGVVWVPDQDYSSCPSIDDILLADDLSQDIFDNCFDIVDGPDAPDLNVVELDREVILVLSNDTLSSNNAFEGYKEVIIPTPTGYADTFYKFQGYKVYQLSSSSITYNSADINDATKYRIVAQVDVKDGVKTIYNWQSLDNPYSNDPVWYPVPQVVESDNQGIRHSFSIKDDQFASGDDTRLVNHKKYYYVAVAYGYNNYENFEVSDPNKGQKVTYIEGRLNIGPKGDGGTYVVVPRPITFQLLGAKYGDGPEIKRYSGVGAGEAALDISDETRTKILDGTFDGEIKYKPGAGPLNVKVYNPLEIKDGEYELSIIDGNTADANIDIQTAKWVLKNITDPSQADIVSESGLASVNEQLIVKYGFSVAVGQTNDAGDLSETQNGYISQTVETKTSESGNWLAGISDSEARIAGIQAFHFVKNKKDEQFYSRDVNQAFTNENQIFVPYRLLGYETELGIDQYLSPAWKNNLNDNVGIQDNPNRLKSLNNVDIVFTSDTSLWSRCVIVETGGTNDFNSAGFTPEGGTGIKSFYLRQSPSVSKQDANNDGLPDLDPVNGVDTIKGLGWFPGYAIDVETGNRLNIYFGENSGYTCVINNVIDLCANGSYLNGVSTGRDMMFNPTSQLILPGVQGIAQFIAGGQHYIYVTKQKYDGCQSIYNALKNNQLGAGVIGSVMNNITWASMMMTQPDQPFKSYREGLVPSDLTVKLRVDDPYQTTKNDENVIEYPRYRFAFSGVQAQAVAAEADVTSALDKVNIVPNPYYAFSEYETDDIVTTVKIVNLPAKCTVTIYSLDGRFIKQYVRDEKLGEAHGNNPGVNNSQIYPDLEWDIKNHKGIPVGSGVYLVHIQAPGLGERVIKWFGVQRKFAPSKF